MQSSLLGEVERLQNAVMHSTHTLRKQRLVFDRSDIVFEVMLEKVRFFLLFVLDG
jgi:hypothetical protein